MNSCRTKRQQTRLDRHAPDSRCGIAQLVTRQKTTLENKDSLNRTIWPARNEIIVMIRKRSGFGWVIDAWQGSCTQIACKTINKFPAENRRIQYLSAFRLDSLQEIKQFFERFWWGLITRLSRAGLIRCCRDFLLQKAVSAAASGFLLAEFLSNCLAIQKKQAVTSQHAINLHEHGQKRQNNDMPLE